VLVSKQRKPPPLTLFPYEWVPLGNAFAQIVTGVGKVELAEIDINRDLRNGLLKSALRQISLSGDGEETRKLLEPADWQHWRVRGLFAEELTAYVSAEGEQFPIDDGWPKTVKLFFVRRAELNKYYPATPPAPTTTSERRTDDGRRKPGPRMKHDWRLHVAVETHRIREKEGRTPTAKELAEFCGSKWDYYPDESDIQKLLRFLLNG